MPADTTQAGGALILAAGAARRFGSDKRRALLANGVAVLDATVRRYAEVFEQVVVVLREEDGELARHLRANSPDVSLVVAAEAPLGMGHSLAAGVRAVASDWAYAAIALGDMPWIRAGTLRTLLDAYLTAPADAIIQPWYGDRPGHPVLFGAVYFPALAGLSGDSGARTLLAQNPGRVRPLATEDPGVVRDIDSPEDLDGRGSGQGR